MENFSLQDLLREAHVYLEFEDVQLLAPFDLNPAEFSALQILSTVGDLRIGDLGDRLLVDKSRTTRIVDHLATRGWAERVADPTDRRATRVRVTAAGNAHRVTVETARAATLPGRFAALSPDDQATLGRLLTNLNHHLIQRSIDSPEKPL